MNLDVAYRRCAAITRVEARNFSYGIRLLPEPKRRAMEAIYAFARRVDDIGDGAGTPAEKLASLEEVRKQLALVARGTPPEDPVLVALADAAQRYGLPLDALEDLVSGCEQDCRQSGYDTYEELLDYCRCVAGSIGRLSVAVFGVRTGGDPARVRQLSEELGAALQITNILRDVVEDRDEHGRVYLPREDLERFGCSADLTGPPGAFSALVRHEAERARRHFEGGLPLLDLLDRRSRACVAAMTGIYWRLLARIASHPESVLRGRVSLAPWEKGWVALRSLAGAA